MLVQLVAIEDTAKHTYAHTYMYTCVCVCVCVVRVCVCMSDQRHQQREKTALPETIAPIHQLVGAPRKAALKRHMAPQHPSLQSHCIQAMHLPEQHLPTPNKIRESVSLSSDS